MLDHPVPGFPRPDALPPATTGSLPLCATCGRPLHGTPGLCLHCLLQAGMSEPRSPLEKDRPLPATPIVAAGSASRGDDFQHYRILTHPDGSRWELGRGGMGVTYKAFDTNLRCHVALKVVHPLLLDHPLMRERFLREARLTARLRHPNVASILHLGAREEECFYAMEFIEGETVEQRVASLGPLPPALALEITAQAARALGAAEQLRLVHRDIKPANLMLARSAANEVHVKLIDFGVALWLDPSAGGGSHERLTEGGLVGTPRFASPEQLAGDAVDTRSDIYALGVTLWFMLSGRTPFAGSPSEVAQAHLHKKPPYRALEPTTPRPVLGLLRAMLQKDPALRPQTSVELLAAIQRCATETGPNATVRAPATPVRWLPGARRRRPGMLLAVAATAVVLCVAGLVAKFQLQPRLLLRKSALPAGRTSASEGPDKSIAVLPFRTIGTDEASVRLADGIHENVLTDLAKNKALKVISHRSVMDPRLQTMSVRETGAALGVATLLEGSVQRADGSHVRVNARLVDARTGKTLRAQSFDGELTELFAFQTRIAQRIAAELRTRFSVEEQRLIERVPTQNLAAYDLYLLGRDCERHAENEGLASTLRAVSLYEKALALDPTFTIAEVRLAYLHARIYWQARDGQPRAEHLAKAREAIQHALQTQPDLPELHEALGYYYYYAHRDFEHATEEFTRALEQLPNDAEVYYGLALIQRRQGRWPEALASFERAVELDPRNARVAINLADTLNGLRRYVDADRITDRILTLSPGDPEALIERGYLEFKRFGTTAGLHRALTATGENVDENSIEFVRYDVSILERRFDDAIAAMQASPRAMIEVEWGIYPRELFIALAWLAKGEREQARGYFESASQVLERLVRTDAETADAVSRYRAALAIAYAGLGRKQEAVREALTAVERRPTSTDAVAGPPIALSLARVYVLVGENERALEQLDWLLAVPFGLSLNRLKFEPCWDPLRGDPRFARLLEKHAGQ